MKINFNSKAEPFISLAAEPAKPNAAAPDVDALKRQWSEGVVGDSFKTWVTETPDPVFLKFVASVEDQFAEKCLNAAMQVMFAIHKTKPEGEKITMDELLASPGYAALTDPEKFAARYCIEHQRGGIQGKG